MEVLVKIISGGQSGADLGGLIAAKEAGISTGGFMPKGFITEFGPKLEYEKFYNIKEHSSDKYPPRTFANVKESDGTLRIFKNKNSRGELCTLKAINQYKKLYFDIDINNPPLYKELVNWIIKNNIKILNVSGNRESTAVGIQKFTENYLKEVIYLVKEYNQGLFDEN